MKDARICILIFIVYECAFYEYKLFNGRLIWVDKCGGVYERSSQSYKGKTEYSQI